MTIMGAIFGVAPEEVGFEGFAAEKSALSGDSTAEKLASAKDKGLNPLLKDVGAFISDEIVSRFNQDLRLEFTGLDVDNAAERWKEKLRHMTINEVRAMFDMPNHPLGWFGDLPADTGAQAAEFQRLNATGTWGELRKMWGGLDAYPSEMMNAAPANPSLGALFQQVLAVPLDGPGGEGGGDAGGDPAGQDGPSQTGSLASRLAALSQDSAPSASLDAIKARAGVGGGEEE